MKKIITAVLVGTLLASGMTVTASAAKDNNAIVSPLWINIARISGKVSVNGSKGSLSALVSGNPEVTQSKATATLYYKSGSSWVKTSTKWNYSVNATLLPISETFSASSGKTYKVVLSGTAYAGSTSEAFSAEFVQN